VAGRSHCNFSFQSTRCRAKRLGAERLQKNTARPIFQDPEIKIQEQNAFASRCKPAAAIEVAQHFSVPSTTDASGISASKLADRSLRGCAVQFSAGAARPSARCPSLMSAEVPEGCLPGPRTDSKSSHAFAQGFADFAVVDRHRAPASFIRFRPFTSIVTVFQRIRRAISILIFFLRVPSRRPV